MKNETVSRGLFFLAGAAAGFALGMYLHSKKGDALREKFAEHVDDLLDDLGERASEQVGDLMSNLTKIVENGLQQIIAPDTENNAEEEENNSFSEDVQEALDEAETTFGAGMENARLRLMKKFAAAGITPAP